MDLWITRLTRNIEFFAIKNRILYYIFSGYYRLLVKREAKLANIGAGDRVLCIGGGVCPYTAILFRQYTGAHITVIDNNSVCIERSTEFINNLGLDRIHVLRNDGKNIDYNGYTVIHIAMQISPKEAVVKQIMKTADNGTRILIRKPKKSVKRLYCTMPLGYDFTKCIKHGLLSGVDNTAVCVVNNKSVPAVGTIS